MDLGYKELRQGKVNGYASRTYKTNLLVFAAKQYTTVFNNNIWMHAYARIRRFLHHFDKDKRRVYKTLDYLFNENNRFQADSTLLDKLVEHLEYDGERFLTIKTDPQKYIRLFYYLQRFNEMFGFRNFNLVPIYKHGLHHVQYDGQAMHSCLSGLKKTRGLKRADFAKVHWEKYFKLPETRNHKFYGSISTDGVAVTFRMERLVPKINEGGSDPDPDPDGVDDKNNDKRYMEIIKKNLINKFVV